MDRLQLIDRLGRRHTNLRLSVTDRCNIRCFYCMPPDGISFQPHGNLLTYEEIGRFVEIVARLGVHQIRITGGEPLVRRDLPTLIRLLRQVNGITDLALTTNGLLLSEHAASLKDAGLQRLNISLDTLSEARFQEISRRSGLDRVLDGIETAMDLGFEKIRLNAIAIKNLTEPEIEPLVRFARSRRLELRFIEFMPLDGEQQWQSQAVLSGEAIRSIIERSFGILTPVVRDDPSQPAVDFEFADGQRIGFINPITAPFCESCNRLRLTCDGQVRSCLFSNEEADARALLRNGAADEDIADLVRDCIAMKKPGHGIDSHQFRRPQRAMFQIGG